VCFPFSVLRFGRYSVIGIENFVDRTYKRVYVDMVDFVSGFFVLCENEGPFLWLWMWWNGEGPNKIPR